MSEIIREGNKTVIKPTGDIVASCTDELKAQFKKVIDEGAASLSVDLSQVEMIDSMGLGILIAAHNTLSKKGVKLGLSHVSADIKKLLSNMRLDRHFDISD